MAVKIFFGAPGSGKSTHAASVVYRNLRKGFPTFANFDVLGAYRYDTKEDLGEYDISECDLIIDEAGIDYNNRQYKVMPLKQIDWFKKYRHHKVRDIYIYSQSFEDMDITLRRLAVEMYHVKRSIIPFLMYTRRIGVDFDIDDETHQAIDKYWFIPFSKRYYFMPLYWHMFDSWEAPKLKPKRWHNVGFGDIIADRKVLRKLAKELRRRRFK